MADEDITGWLVACRQGTREALDNITPVLYAELRRLAQAQFRFQDRSHTLQPTALVHEAYLKLVDQSQLDFKDRTHFFGLAARVMRQVLVDHARARNATKRGGDNEKIPLVEGLVGGQKRCAGVVALNDALDSLAQVDPRKARLVELRFFGGLTGEEMSEEVGISTATVTRELRLAEAWLHRAMGTPAG